MNKLFVIAVALVTFVSAVSAAETTDAKVVAQALVVPLPPSGDIRPSEESGSTKVVKPIITPAELTPLSKPPAMKVGDRIVYQGYASLDYAQRGVGNTWIQMMQVADVKSNGDIVFEVGGNPNNVRVFSSENNLVERRVPQSDVQKYAPSYQEQVFPLEIGKDYPVRFSFNPDHPDANRQKFRCSGNGKAIGWEEVKVPAGTFKALKIELSGKCDVDPSGWVYSYKTVKWLAPALKMQTALYYEKIYWGDDGKRGSENIYSVSSYSLQ